MIAYDPGERVVFKPCSNKSDGKGVEGEYLMKVSLKYHALGGKIMIIA